MRGLFAGGVICASPAVGLLAELSQPEKKKPDKAPDPPPIEIPLDEAPQLLFHSEIGMRHPDGVLGAVWANGRAVRCQDPAKPGQELLTTELPKSAVESAMKVIRLFALQSKDRAPTCTSLDTLCVRDDTKLVQIRFAHFASDTQFDNLSIRFFLSKDLINRLCASARTPVKNLELLNQCAGHMARHGTWQPD